MELNTAHLFLELWFWYRDFTKFRDHLIQLLLATDSDGMECLWRNLTWNRGQWLWRWTSKKGFMALLDSSKHWRGKYGYPKPLVGFPIDNNQYWTILRSPHSGKPPCVQVQCVCVLFCFDMVSCEFSLVNFGLVCAVVLCWPTFSRHRQSTDFRDCNDPSACGWQGAQSHWYNVRSPSYKLVYKPQYQLSYLGGLTLCELSL